MKQAILLVGLAATAMAQALKQNNTYTFNLSWRRGSETCLAGENRAQPSGAISTVYGTCWDTTAYRT